MYIVFTCQSHRIFSLSRVLHIIISHVIIFSYDIIAPTYLLRNSFQASKIKYYFLH